MNQQANTAIAVLDEMIEETRKIIPVSNLELTDKVAKKSILNQAKSRIQELDYMSNNGWIPVTERLPEKDGEYLVFDPDDSLISDYFIHEEWQYTKPTHWMPLPLPPNN